MTFILEILTKENSDKGYLAVPRNGILNLFQREYVFDWLSHDLYSCTMSSSFFLTGFTVFCFPFFSPKFIETLIWVLLFLFFFRIHKDLLFHFWLWSVWMRLIVLRVEKNQTYSYFSPTPPIFCPRVKYCVFYKRRLRKKN